MSDNHSVDCPECGHTYDLDEAKWHVCTSCAKFSEPGEYEGACAYNPDVVCHSPHSHTKYSEESAKALEYQLGQQNIEAALTLEDRPNARTALISYYEERYGRDPHALSRMSREDIERKHVRRVVGYLGRIIQETPYIEQEEQLKLLLRDIIRNHEEQLHTRQLAERIREDLEL